MRNIFNSRRFTPTKWDSAEQKAKFANQFVKFVNSDFKKTFFPHWFYKRLSMCFGFIAHYNDSGFYATYFIHTGDKIQFLKRVITYACYSDPMFTYGDVESVLKQWVIDNEFIALYTKQFNNEVEKRERGELKRLKEKYGE